jgi:hypothetical protein
VGFRKKKQQGTSLAVLALAGGLGGCATIVAKSTQTIIVGSVPEGAADTITNASGEAVHSGNTPMSVTLKKGRGYFKPEHYVVRVIKEGFEPQQLKVDGAINGWYFGNIIFGGLIGMLAVDPATGAMYTLAPKDVKATLSTSTVTHNQGERTLTVALVKDRPELRDQLVAVGVN